MRKASPVALLAVIAVLGTTSAGDFVWARVLQLEGQCYAAIGNYAPRYTSIACQAVGGGVNALGQASTYVRAAVERQYYALVGGTDMGSIGPVLTAAQERLGGLASPLASLQQMTKMGLRAPEYATSSNDIAQSFQRSVDSYAIGRDYLQSGKNAANAVPWFEYGAKQPMGLGLFSQMTLAQMYLQGAPGVQENPELAAFYLQQAKASIQTLQAAKTPQSTQLLSLMKTDPNAALRDIDRLLAQVMQGQFSHQPN